MCNQYKYKEGQSCFSTPQEPASTATAYFEKPRKHSRDNSEYNPGKKNKKQGNETT